MLDGIPSAGIEDRKTEIESVESGYVQCEGDGSAADVRWK